MILDSCAADLLWFAAQKGPVGRYKPNTKAIIKLDDWIAETEHRIADNEQKITEAECVTAAGEPLDRWQRATIVQTQMLREHAREIREFRNYLVSEDEW